MIYLETINSAEGCTVTLAAVACVAQDGCSGASADDAQRNRAVNYVRLIF